MLTVLVESVEIKALIAFDGREAGGRRVGWNPLRKHQIQPTCRVRMTYLSIARWRPFFPFSATVLAQVSCLLFAALIIIMSRRHNLSSSGPVQSRALKCSHDSLLYIFHVAPKLHQNSTVQYSNNFPHISI